MRALQSRQADSNGFRSLLSLMLVEEYR